MKASKRYEISSEEIDPSTIYISVELTPDVPIDRLQRINGAVQMASQLPGVPMTYILEELGVPDPDKAIEDWQEEQLEKAYMQGNLQLIQAQSSGQLQQMVQQGVQQAMQAQQAQAAQAQQQGAGPGGQPMSPDQIGQFGQMANAAGPLAGMNPSPGGQGFNPAGGGLPPALASGGAPLTSRGLNAKDNLMGMPVPAVG